MSKPAASAKSSMPGTMSRLIKMLFSFFPVLLPFLFLTEPVPALRLSHAIALAMLMGIGYGLARYAGSRRSWLIGVLFAAAGVAIVMATIALGG